MSVELSIIVRTRFEAIHKWPECPFDDVSFLKDSHRHIFHVRAEKVVIHDNRDIEIIKFKRKIEDYLRKITSKDKNIGAMSCEQLAEAIMSEFGCSEVEVSEDGENGAIARLISDRKN